MQCREEGDVSPRLVRALEGLGANLGRLAAALDGVVFRDTWRAVAVAATRAMFNDVATEARFSEQARPLPAPLFRGLRIRSKGGVLSVPAAAAAAEPLK